MAQIRNGQIGLGKPTAHRPRVAFVSLLESTLCFGTSAMGSMQPDRAIRPNSTGTPFPEAGLRDWPVVAACSPKAAWPIVTVPTQSRIRCIRIQRPLAVSQEQLSSAVSIRP